MLPMITVDGEHEEVRADVRLGEASGRSTEAGPGEERAHDHETEREDDQGHVPDLEGAPPLLHHHRVQKAVAAIQGMNAAFSTGSQPQ